MVHTVCESCTKDQWNEEHSLALSSLHRMEGREKKTKEPGKENIIMKNGDGNEDNEEGRG